MQIKRERREHSPQPVTPCSRNTVWHHVATGNPQLNRSHCWSVNWPQRSQMQSLWRFSCHQTFLLHRKPAFDRAQRKIPLRQRSVFHIWGQVLRVHKRNAIWINHRIVRMVLNQVQEHSICMSLEDQSTGLILCRKLVNFYFLHFITGPWNDRSNSKDSKHSDQLTWYCITVEQQMKCAHWKWYSFLHLCLLVSPQYYSRS